MAPEVTITDSKGLTAELAAGEPATPVASGDVTIVVRGKSSRVELDGKEKVCIPIGNDRVFNIDLSRSTGYHSITIDGLNSYRFATVDAKLKLQGVRDMLAVLQRRTEAARQNTFVFVR